MSGSRAEAIAPNFKSSCHSDCLERLGFEYEEKGWHGTQPASTLGPAPLKSESTNSGETTDTSQLVEHSLDVGFEGMPAGWVDINTGVYVDANPLHPVREAAGAAEQINGLGRRCYTVMHDPSRPSPRILAAPGVESYIQAERAPCTTLALSSGSPG